jgi:outer membrane lipoprotein SlyB
LTGDAPSRATITGNAAGRYFGVRGYGSFSELLVNTTDPYEGTVRVDGSTMIIVVQAEGEWTIVFE